MEQLRQFKADLFQALANPTRIAIVELLRDEGEVSVSRIFEALGLVQSNASQHLSVLRNRHVVNSRKEGNVVYYSLRDPMIGRLLDLTREYFFSHLSEVTAMLHSLDQDGTGK